MVDVYVKLILKGRRNIDDVPLELKDAVIEALEEQGWIPPNK